MTQSAGTSGFGFKELYLDESFYGHIFIKPSLWTYETFGRAFAPLEVKGASSIIEVVDRIGIFCLAAVSAVFSLVLALLGVIIKGGEVLWRDIPENQQVPAINSDTHTSISAVVTQTLGQSNSNQNSTLPAQSSPTNKLLAQAKPILDHASAELGKISWSNVNLEKVLAVRLLLEGNRYLFREMIATPTERKGDPNPFDETIETYQQLLCWIDSLERKHLCQVSRKEHPEGTTKNNGDCLFEAFVKVLEINKLIEVPNFEAEKQLNKEWILENYKTDPELQQILTQCLYAHYKPTGEHIFVEAEIQSFLEFISTPTSSFLGFLFPVELYALAHRCNICITVYKAGEYERPSLILNGKNSNVFFFKYDNRYYRPYMAHAQRLLSVAWIRQNYSTNKEVLLALINSIEGHFWGEMDKLDREKSSLINAENSGAILVTTVGRKEEIEREQNSIMKEKLMLLCEARGGADNPMRFEPIEKLILEYLDLMQKPSVFGGAAELYALSCLHKVCTKIHGDAGVIFNQQYECTPKHVINLRFTHAHYDVFIPEQAK